MDEPIPAKDSIIDGAYRIIETLGTGAMGVVLLAWDLRLERNVAIKLIRSNLFDTQTLRERFLAEARAMARVNHPNVLQVHSFGQHENAPYFVSEFVEGMSVEDWMKSYGGAPPHLRLSLQILDDVCHGLTAIHAAATVHRDLKPANILLDLDLRARIADLGLSNIRQQAAAIEDDIVGTAAYMAPEITLQSRTVAATAHRCDIYSLGCIAFELLTGRLPFVANGDLPMMVAHTTQPAPRASEVSPALGTAFDAALLGALEKDPAKRTSTAEVFRRELEAAAKGSREPVRILVAEDDEDFRAALTLGLAREFPGCVIESVADGAAGLVAFDRQTPSVAILDLQMPGLDGIELTRLLRSRPAAAKVPILVLTASGGPQEWKKLSALGADGFLVKPVNLKDVATLVRRTLEERA